VLDGIKEAGEAAGIEVVSSVTDDVDEGVTAMEGADAVVLCGATTSTEGKDRSSLLVDQDDFLSEILDAALIPSVVVTLTPGASVLTNWVDKADSVLNLFLSGEETGHSVADVLFGSVNPSGKLPVTFPLSEEYAVAPCRFTVKECVYDEGVLVGYRGLQDKDVGFR